MTGGASAAAPPAAASRRELERRALHLVHDRGLPAPQVNVLVDDHEVDLFWPDARLVVELDSHTFQPAMQPADYMARCWERIAIFLEDHDSLDSLS